MTESGGVTLSQKEKQNTARQCGQRGDLVWTWVCVEVRGAKRYESMVRGLRKGPSRDGPM